MRHGLKYVKQYYDGGDSCEGAIGKMKKNIFHALYHRDNYVNYYDYHSGLIR